MDHKGRPRRTARDKDGAGGDDDDDGRQRRRRWRESTTMVPEARTFMRHVEWARACARSVVRLLRIGGSACGSCAFSARTGGARAAGAGSARRGSQDGLAALWARSASKKYISVFFGSRRFGLHACREDVVWCQDGLGRALCMQYWLTSCVVAATMDCLLFFPAGGEGGPQTVGRQCSASSWQPRSVPVGSFRPRCSDPARGRCVVVRWRSRPAHL